MRSRRTIILNKWDFVRCYRVKEKQERVVGIMDRALKTQGYQDGQIAVIQSVVCLP
jgi:hypothetical protein